MKKLFRIFLFISAFQLEVRVRAAGDILEQPQACFKTPETCAIQVLSPAFHVVDKSKKIHAASGSTVMRLSDNQWRLVQGTLWVEKGSLEVQTPYADLKADKGQYWVITQEDRILVRNMDSDVVVTLRDGKTVQLPEGFEFWVARLDSKGQTDYGMIKPIDMAEHLPLWNSLYVGSKDAFKKEVLGFKSYWGDMAVKSSAIYKEIILRDIAAEDAAKEAAVLKKQREAAEARRLRQIYWQRSFER